MITCPSLSLSSLSTTTTTTTPSSTHALAAALLHIPHRGFSHSVGQRGEPGAGPPTIEQSPGRRLGPQAAAGSVHRDLCPGHWQHAAQPVPGGFVGPPGATAALCDHLPAGGSRGWKDNELRRWQELAPAPQQCHHALYPLQTQGAQRRAVPAEPDQDPHADVLPTSAGRTRPEGQRAQPRDVHLSVGALTDVPRSGAAPLLPDGNETQVFNPERSQAGMYIGVNSNREVTLKCILNIQRLRL